MAPAEQRRYITKVAKVCNCDDETALKFLRAAKWDMQRAVDNFYQSGHEMRNTASLKEIFRSYHQADDQPDHVGIEGAMRFFSDINVSLEEVVCLAISELCKSPSMGEFTEEGFVAGWASVNCLSIEQMTAHAELLRKVIKHDDELARRTYRYTFILCRMQGQRNVQFEIASEQWKLLFGKDTGILPGNSATTPWVDWFLEFLEGRGKKPVIKDLWEQLELFFRKANKDESLSWFDSNGAWPGAIDEFVDWVNEKRASEMEVE